MNEIVERLVKKAADAVAHENPYDIATGDSTPTAFEVHLAKVVTIAVLRELERYAIEDVEENSIHALDFDELCSIIANS